jgi:putative endonuclease
MHYVYIIKNIDNILYKGYTLDIQKRLIAHNEGLSRYTKNKGPWSLVFIKYFKEKSEALQFEKLLKRQNRRYLDWLISSDKNELSGGRLG